MEACFALIAHGIALLLEAVSVLLIALGAGEAVMRLLKRGLHASATQGIRRDAWLSFARWLLLALEFTLAADIVKTAIAPSWDDIGQLAAIAAIRTFLNYFLEHDLEKATPSTRRKEAL
ncbi:MAG: DUF1622 domain-containing protein [Alphaproteobacteria bacterium]